MGGGSGLSNTDSPWTYVDTVVIIVAEMTGPRLWIAARKM